MKGCNYILLIFTLVIISCNGDNCDVDIYREISSSFGPESQLVIEVPSMDKQEILIDYQHITGESGTDVSSFTLRSEDQRISFLTEKYFDTIYVATATANHPMTTFNSLSSFTPDANSVVTIESFYIRPYPKINDSRYHTSPIESYDSDSLVISKIDNSILPSPLGSFSIVADFWKNINHKYIHFVVNETSEKGYILLSADDNRDLTIHKMGICD